MTRTGFRLMPLCMPFTVFSQHFACHAQASGQHFLEYVIPFLAGFAFVSLFSAILVPMIGMTGVYAANIRRASGFRSGKDSVSAQTLCGDSEPSSLLWSGSVRGSAL